MLNLIKWSSVKHAGKLLAKEVIISGLLTAAALAVLRYVSFHNQPAPTANLEMRGPLASVGQEFSLKGRSFGGSSINTILVTSPSCPYCRQSERFHASLLAAARSAGNGFYVAVPNLERRHGTILRRHRSAGRS